MISVIITTKDDGSNLLNLLKSLNISNRKLPKEIGEIIVVDNFSQDNTHDICKKFNIKFFKYGNERSAQRNFGLKRSMYKYLLFLDSDMILTKSFLRELSTKKYLEFDIGYLNEYILANVFFERIRNYERKLYDQTMNNCPRLIKKTLIKKIKGFNEKVTGFEDWDLNNKLRKFKLKKFMFKSKVLHNERNLSFLITIKKKTYYLINSIQLFKTMHTEQTGFFFRFFGIYFYKENFTVTLSNPITFILTFLYKNFQLIVIIFFFFYLVAFKNINYHYKR